MSTAVASTFFILGHLHSKIIEDPNYTCRLYLSLFISLEVQTEKFQKYLLIFLKQETCYILM